MDLLIGVVFGIVGLAILTVWIMLTFGFGEQFLSPLIAVLGAPVVRLGRHINAVRRERSIKKLPPGVPPPPPAP
jgi:MFS superfamily sulfate permease-like transporter